MCCARVWRFARPTHSLVDSRMGRIAWARGCGRFRVEPARQQSCPARRWIVPQECKHRLSVRLLTQAAMAQPGPTPWRLSVHTPLPTSELQKQGFQSRLLSVAVHRMVRRTLYKATRQPNSEKCSVLSLLSLSQDLQN